MSVRYIGTEGISERNPQRGRVLVEIAVPQTPLRVERLLTGGDPNVGAAEEELARGEEDGAAQEKGLPPWEEESFRRCRARVGAQVWTKTATSGQKVRPPWRLSSVPGQGGLL